jgi:toxin ParE1/3/4
MAHRLAPQARAELDDIWDYITRERGNAAVADSVVGSITNRFHLLGQYRRLGRARDDLRPGLRSYPADDYVIIYTIDGADGVILHALHGRRDIEGLIDR